ncbi:hypothetical protein [Rhizobium tumorigenes]|uniref:Uncharacterized protein n=1 Tax=Rhizobium tumorigenes TaxID=2041385 RepID=A0AAF1KSM4_9HYPH|nr:hypothetical protein [Rhizobium tumorigenes]WFR94796.1 hypothetical protein PR017_13370 [Rhizobium tumorigenes]
MTLKRSDTRDTSLRDIWSLHEFARLNLLDKKQIGRLKMLMGPVEERQDANLDHTSR